LTANYVVGTGPIYRPTLAILIQYNILHHACLAYTLCLTKHAFSSCRNIDTPCTLRNVCTELHWCSLCFPFWSCRFLY